MYNYYQQNLVRNNTSKTISMIFAMLRRTHTTN